MPNEEAGLNTQIPALLLIRKLYSCLNTLAFCSVVKNRKASVGFKRETLLTLMKMYNS